MRVLFLALLIALLPVRGWMGNAMAVGMGAHQVMLAQQAVAAGGHEVDASAMPEDCPMHAQASEAGTPEAGDPHGNGCNTCQLCLSFASFSWPRLQASDFAAHAEPLAGGSHFTSAERAPGFKPPIF
jgi:hypothetical protein